MSRALPTRPRPSFSHHPSLPPRGLHKSQLHPSEGRQKKEETVSQKLKQKPYYRKLIILRKAESYVPDEAKCESPSVVSDSLKPNGLVHGILQARILDQIAVPFSRGSSQPRDQTQVSHTASGIFLPAENRGSPRILEWVAYPFSSRSSSPRN